MSSPKLARPAFAAITVLRAFLAWYILELKSSPPSAGLFPAGVPELNGAPIDPEVSTISATFGEIVRLRTSSGSIPMSDATTCVMAESPAVSIMTAAAQPRRSLRAHACFFTTGPPSKRVR